MSRLNQKSRSLPYSVIAIITLVSAATIPVGGQEPVDNGDPTIGLVIDEDRLQANRIRKLTGKHLTLYTDLPSSDQVDELTEIFDQAVGHWQAYFGVKDVSKFKATGFLIKDKSLFQRGGVIPKGLPEFKNGYTFGKKSFWMVDQPSEFMRRQLMIHEGTHAFLFSHFGLDISPWYNEGLAELFGAHRWRDGKLETRVTVKNRDEAPYWGRTKLIRDNVATGQALTLTEVSRLPSSSFLKTEPYCWVWCMSSFLDQHPEYGPAFKKLILEFGKPGGIDTAFANQFGDNLAKMDAEWRALLADMDYGVNAVNALIDFEPAKIERNQLRLIEAAKSWQNSGVKVQAGKSYRIRSKGRYVIRQSQINGKLTDWPCEPNGITLDYYRGQPLGKLMMVVLPEKDSQEVNFAKPIPVSLSTNFKPELSGKLFFRVNESPAELHDNSGNFLLSIVEE